jgi:hypothetical protein
VELIGLLVAGVLALALVLGVIVAVRFVVALVLDEGQ